ncbi:hypothetical protein [Modicisalibacter luteus]|uniref:Uncharacterized protein n=1 Tax=Modicisalibacter luteus TaxID=453962 RepID=A0ABV7M2R7_9GAMM|nr:hypothetical protein [Halomonas lutea]
MAQALPILYRQIMALVGDLASRTVDPLIDVGEQKKLCGKEKKAEHDALEHGGELWREGGALCAV